MADETGTRRGSFWMWASVVIVAALILVWWLDASSIGVEGEEIPPVETGRIDQDGAAPPLAAGIASARPTLA